MHPDTVIDPLKRTTVLHELMSRAYPPQLAASGTAEAVAEGEAAREGGQGGGGFSLQQLLDRRVACFWGVGGKEGAHFSLLQGGGGGGGAGCASSRCV